MNKIYTHKSPFFALFQFKMLGYLLLVIGIYNSLSTDYGYIFISLPGLLLASLSDGIQIDFEKKLSREYISVVWIKFGKWNLIPDTDYVTVYIQNLSQGMNMVSITSNNPSASYKISIIGKDESQTDAGTYKSKDAALKIAEQISKKFNVECINNIKFAD